MPSPRESLLSSRGKDLINAVDALIEVLGEHPVNTGTAISLIDARNNLERTIDGEKGGDAA